jgi:ketosteroid isomerase-like protein
MTNLERAQDIYAMMGQGQLLEAFDKYYAENVVMQEAGEPAREGKAVNRQYEEQFTASIEEFHGMGVTAMASNEETGVVMSENWFEATIKGAGRVHMQQVNVQTWKDGQVIKEVFYHK